MTVRTYKRFAYVPIGEWFQVGSHGTTLFKKINEDQAYSERGRAHTFALDERCAWPIDNREHAAEGKQASNG